MIPDPTRQLVVKEVGTLDFECHRLDTAVEVLQNLISVHGPEAFIHYERDYDDVPYLSIKVQRLETDEEMAARIKQEEDWLSRERHLYERLKRKFEGEGK
jgi:hypothetical protein